MSRMIEPGDYAVTIKFTLSEPVPEKTLDAVFEHAMYERLGEIESSDIGEYRLIEKPKIKFDVCVYGYVYTIEAENENEAKAIACDLYYEETLLKAYTDDDAVAWKTNGEYPYEWK